MRAQLKEKATQPGEYVTVIDMHCIVFVAQRCIAGDWTVQYMWCCVYEVVVSENDRYAQRVQGTAMCPAGCLGRWIGKWVDVCHRKISGKMSKQPRYGKLQLLCWWGVTSARDPGRSCTSLDLGSVEKRSDKI